MYSKFNEEQFQKSNCKDDILKRLDVLQMENRKIENDLLKRLDVLQMENWKIENDLLKRLDILQMENWKIRDSLLKQIDDVKNLIQQNIIASDDFYLMDYARKIHSLFDIHSINAKYPFCRLGKKDDGGYLLVDHFEKCNVVYSIGISNDVSWDLSMLEKGVKEIYMYDHTINGLCVENDKFHWKKVGITGIYDERYNNLITLDMMLKQNKHMQLDNMILKIDVEGAEWKVFANMAPSITDKFAQILIEFHNLCDISDMAIKEKALENISKTHVPVHVHGNNFEKYICCKEFCLPNALEVTYVNKKNFGVKPIRKFFPTILDKPNDGKFHDIILGYWGHDR